MNGIELNGINDNRLYSKTSQTRAYYSTKQTDYVLMNKVLFQHSGQGMTPFPKALISMMSTKVHNMHRTNIEDAFCIVNVRG